MGAVVGFPTAGGAKSTADMALNLLCVIARLHGIAVDQASLTHQLALCADAPADFELLRLAAHKLELKARVESVALARLPFTPLPALTTLQDGSWVIVAAANAQQVLLPGLGSVAR